MEQLQGYFWPMDVYKRVKGQTPEKSLPIRAQAEQDLEPDLKHKKSKSKIRSKVRKSKVYSLKLKFESKSKAGRLWFVNVFDLLIT